MSFSYQHSPSLNSCPRECTANGASMIDYTFFWLACTVQIYGGMKEEEEQQAVALLNESCLLTFILPHILLSNSLSLTMNHQADSKEEKSPSSHCINNTDYSFLWYLKNCSLFYLMSFFPLIRIKWKDKTFLINFWLSY